MGKLHWTTAPVCLSAVGNVACSLVKYVIHSIASCVRFTRHAINANMSVSCMHGMKCATVFEDLKSHSGSHMTLFFTIYLTVV